MKRKDWLEKQKDVDPMRGRKIRCPDCGNDMGYEKDYGNMVLTPPGLVCPVCDEVVIHVPTIMCSTGAEPAAVC